MPNRSRSSYVSEGRPVENSGPRREPPTTQQVQEFINRIAGTAGTVVAEPEGVTVESGGVIYTWPPVDSPAVDRRQHTSQGLPDVITGRYGEEVRRWGTGPLAGHEVRSRPSEQLTQAQRERFRELDNIAIASQFSASQSRPTPQPVPAHPVTTPEPIDVLHPKPRAIDLEGL